MCGRYSLFTQPSDLQERFDLAQRPDVEPTYNAAPGQELPIVRNDAPDRIETAEWGLLPEWADGDDGPINARVETVDEKPAFREAYRRRRCLVPADGFYEWVEEDGRRQPYRVAFEDDRPFAMAGIWERREETVEQTGLEAFGDGDDAGPKHRVRETFAVLTTEPNDLVADLHDRMAVVLPRDRERAWLTGDLAAEDVADPYPADDLRAYPVSRAVNDPGNDSPDLIEPARG